MNAGFRRFMAVLIVLIIICMAHWAFGSDIQMKTSIYKLVSTDSENIIQGGAGFSISAHLDRLFLRVGKDTMGMRWTGQSSPDLNIHNISLGLIHRLGKYLTLSASLGWYDPSFKGMDEPQPYPDSPFSEGLCRYLNFALIPDDSYPAWDWYSLKYQGAMGGELNLNFEYPITESWMFELVAGWRYLKLNETIKGHHWDNHLLPDGKNNDFWANNYWVIIRERDVGAYTIGATISYKF